MKEFNHLLDSNSTRYKFKDTIIQAYKTLHLKKHSLEDIYTFLESTYKAKVIDEDLVNLFGKYVECPQKNIVRIYEICDSSVIKSLINERSYHYYELQKAQACDEISTNPNATLYSHYKAKGCLYLVLLSTDAVFLDDFYYQNFDSDKLFCQMSFLSGCKLDIDNGLMGNHLIYMKFLIEEGILII